MEGFEVLGDYPRLPPWGVWHEVEPTAEQVREACARACVDLWDLRDGDLARMYAAKCADAIRALDLSKIGK